MNSKLKNEANDYLFEAILQLNNVDECYDFFEDICTVNEIKSISQRIAVAKMLREGHIYSDIVAATGASTATISRVNRSLLYGNNGYDTVFDRLENKKD
jgi:TrpR-related protein YerC/YecD